VNSFSLFCRLCSVSPAPYSAFLKYEDKAVISSSPECFIHIQADGLVEMRPIKGSAARGLSEEEDKKIADKLYNSTKDRAENLMIVDLCRNDLSRGCKPGSVKVTQLYSIEQYATVHHMVSRIQGQKKPSECAIDVVKSCFPPGSMTGAPKIKAMEYCNTLEKHQRGIYSGAIGWFGGDGSVNLSVVIRTLLIDKNLFEFQVGGGIVLDSDPELEWHETLIKARGIGHTLGIVESQLEQL
jgi:para-aminobenzoate synthetase component 1